MIVRTSGSGAPAKINFKMLRTDSLEKSPNSLCAGSTVGGVCVGDSFGVSMIGPLLRYSVKEDAHYPVLYLVAGRNWGDAMVRWDRCGKRLCDAAVKLSSWTVTKSGNSENSVLCSRIKVVSGTFI